MSCDKKVQDKKKETNCMLHTGLFFEDFNILTSSARSIGCPTSTVTCCRQKFDKQLTISNIEMFPVNAAKCNIYVFCTCTRVILSTIAAVTF